MASAGNTYRVGFGSADITPEPGIQLGGDIGRRRPVEEVRMPLFARALVVRRGERTVCVLQVDVIGVAGDIARELNAEIARMLDTEPDAILFHACQSHSAPAVGHFWAVNESPYLPSDLWWLRGGDDRYITPFRKGVLKAVAAAKRSMTVATLHLGRGMDGRAAFNRRFIMRDGSARCHPPLCSPEILHNEGPTDPEVGVAVFRSKTGQPVGAILHHTCHPCHGYPQHWVHPDWPGAWAEAFAAAIGAPGRALTLNGFCGNIHHRNHLDPKQEDTIERMTGFLTETAQRVSDKLVPSQSATLAWDARLLEMPWRKLTREKIAQARALLEKHPEPMWRDASRMAVEWDWCYAVAALDLVVTQRLHQSFPYHIQTLRIGDLALVAWPGEPFVEAQLAVKQGSPAPFLFTAHMNCTGGIAGYQMDGAAMRRGGYETWTANTSRLSPKAPDMACKATREMVARLF